MQTKTSKTDFSGFLEWGDHARITQYLSDKGFHNPVTKMPYSYRTIRGYFTGVIKYRNDIIESGVVSFLEERKLIQSKVQALQRPTN